MRNMGIIQRMTAIMALLCAFAANASAPADSVSADEAVANHAATATERVTPRTGRPAAFVWGADLSGGVDCSGHNMSTLGIAAQFGMQWQWIRFLGVGAEADIMTGNSSRTVPLSMIFRTDFRRTRQLCFLELRGGVALNYLDNDPQETVPYGSVGLGVTLASGRTFASHLILAYTYNGRKVCYSGDRRRDCPGMSFATFRIGLAF